MGILLAYLAGAPLERGAESLAVGGMRIAWWRAMLLMGLLPTLAQVIAGRRTRAEVWPQPGSARAGGFRV